MINPIEVKLKLRAAWISLLVSALVLTMKFIAYYMTASKAILSDALESIVNVIAALVALWVMKFVAEPADEEHPYGHGKVEFFSSAFEGGLIFFAAIAIAIEAISSLYNGVSPRSLDVGLFIMIGAGVINFFLSLFLKQTGEKYHSPALVASASHVMSDVWTTLGVLLALGIVMITKQSWVDPAVALLVSVQLGVSGYKLVSSSLSALLDARDLDLLEEISIAIEKNRQPSIIEIHNLRTVRSGSFHHIDAHVVVPQFWDVAQAHDETVKFESQLFKDYRFKGEIAFHVDPCEQLYCKSCSYEPCDIRKAKFVAHRAITVQTLMEDPFPDSRVTTN